MLHAEVRSEFISTNPGSPPNKNLPNAPCSISTISGAPKPPDAKDVVT